MDPKNQNEMFLFDSCEFKFHTPVSQRKHGKISKSHIKKIAMGLHFKFVSGWGGGRLINSGFSLGQLAVFFWGPY